MRGLSRYLRIPDLREVGGNDHAGPLENELREKYARSISHGGVPPAALPDGP
jgi:hypothetical protein